MDDGISQSRNLAVLGADFSGGGGNEVVFKCSESRNDESQRFGVERWRAVALDGLTSTQGATAARSWKMGGRQSVTPCEKGRFMGDP